MAEDAPQQDDQGPIADDFEARFLREKHAAFVLSLDEKTDTFEFHVTEHLRLSGVYWGATAMDLLGCLDRMDGAAVVEWTMTCQREGGGFGGAPGHDAHMLYTLSAVQVLALFDRLDRVDAARVAAYVAGLQQEDGSFCGDEWGERDTRFTYCALNCLALLGRLGDADVPAAVRHVAACRNFDGGFGTVPGAESHSGQIFCCVGALAIGGALKRDADADLLGWWLAERQLPCGGLNGRPEKKEDVCYSWWVLSALSALGKISWIDRKKLGEFIIRSQDEDGGIADRPGNIADVFHTFFGVAGLSLLGYPGFKAIDPVFALPVHVIERLGIPRLYSTE